MLIPFVVTPAILQNAAPDRSGEPALRRVLSALTALRGLHVVVTVGSRPSDGSIFEPGPTFTLLFDGSNRFNLASTGGWGEGRRAVCDGTTLLIDPMDGSGSVVLKAAAKTLHASDEGLAAEGEPLLQLLSGPESIDDIVAKGGFVTEFDPPGSERAIRFKSLKKGTASLYYEEAAGRTLVTRIEYDNKEWLESQHKQFPEWYEKPENPLTVMSIRYISVGGKLPVWAFDTNSPRGTKTIDQRPKPKSR